MHFGVELSAPASALLLDEVRLGLTLEGAGLLDLLSEVLGRELSTFTLLPPAASADVGIVKPVCNLQVQF